MALRPNIMLSVFGYRFTVNNHNIAKHQAPSKLIDVTANLMCSKILVFVFICFNFLIMTKYNKLVYRSQTGGYLPPYVSL